MAKRKYAIYGMYGFDVGMDESPRGYFIYVNALVKLTHEDVMALAERLMDETESTLDWNKDMDLICQIRRKLVRNEGFTEVQSWQTWIVWSEDLKCDVQDYYEEHQK